jgi:hypothetical protein
MDRPGSRSPRTQAAGEVAKRAYAKIDEALGVVLGLMQGAQNENVRLHAARLVLEIAVLADGAPDAEDDRTFPVLVEEGQTPNEALERHWARTPGPKRGRPVLLPLEDVVERVRKHHLAQREAKRSEGAS